MDCFEGGGEDVVGSGPFIGLDYSEVYCSSSSYGGLFSMAMLLWVLALITFLGSTASDYLSPTLTKICENLNLSYNVAGVTFLALGNGAPDVFSSLSSFTTSEATTSIGINASLGGSVFICTVLVGSVAIICPCFVSKDTFLRDISFHLIAVLTISVVAAARDIYISTSLIMFSIYLVYVMTIIILSRVAQKRTEEAVKAGIAAKKNIRKIRDDNARNAPLRTFGNAVQQAYWYKNDNPKSSEKDTSAGVTSSSSSSSTDFSRQPMEAEIRGVGKTGYTFLILDENDRDDDDEGGKDGTRSKAGDSKGSDEKASKGDDSNDDSDDEEDLTINLSGGLVGGYFAGEIIEDYIPLPSAEERNMARVRRPYGLLSTLDTSGGVQALLRDAMRFVLQGNNKPYRPYLWETADDGESSHNPLTDDLLSRDGVEEDEERSTGGGEFRNDSLDIEMKAAADGGPSYGLLPGASASPITTPPRVWESRANRRGRTPASTRRGMGGEDSQGLAVDLYWQRWYTRHRIRRHIQASEFWSLPWYKRTLWLVELPLRFLRDVTIPTLEEASWSKTFAVMHPSGMAFMTMRAFGVHFTVAAVLLSLAICALPTTAIFLLTQNSKPPQQSLLRVVWTLGGFYSCIMWIYLLAGELIVCLEVLGLVWEISPAYLGLTVLAWGNCVGDLFSITSLARKGLGEMALAGCYGGPVFNLLFGLGLAMGVASLDRYPAAFHIAFNTSSYISLAFCMLALGCTIIIVPLRGWKLEQGLGFLLIGLYVAYTVVQIIVSL